MRGLEKIFGDHRNMIALVSGVVFLVLFMLVGLALDNIRASRVSGRLVAALDAAALGGAKLLDQGRVKDADISAYARDVFASRTRAMHLQGVTLQDVVVHMNRGRSSVTITAHGTVAPIFGRVLSLVPAKFRQTSRMAFQSSGRSHRTFASVRRLESDSGQIAAFQAAAKDVTSPSGSAQRPSPAVAAAMSIVPSGRLTVTGNEGTAEVPLIPGSTDKRLTARDLALQRGGMHACRDTAPLPAVDRVRQASHAQFVGYARECQSPANQAPTSSTMQRDGIDAVGRAATAGPVRPRALDLARQYGFPDHV